MTVYTPETLAERWHCSPRHVRNLTKRGELRFFKLGGKLLRIPADAVEEYECLNTPSANIEGDSPSSSIETGSGTVTRLEPLTRAKLSAVRRPSSQS